LLGSNDKALHGKNCESFKSVRDYPPVVRSSATTASSSSNTDSLYSSTVSMSGLHISKDGKKILASYQGDQIYTFDACNESNRVGASAVIGGHINYSTFLKSVSFFGQNDEYVLSGSDSGHMWMWQATPSPLFDDDKNEYQMHENKVCKVVNLLKAGKFASN
jgi:hypothetical protein